jgi:hypothetical protein
VIRWARWGAMALAVLALVDPSFETDRGQDARVAVVAATPADLPLAREVAAELGLAFRVVEGAFPAASATVLVGRGLPDGAESLPAPVFGVIPDRVSPAILSIRAPGTAAVGTRTPVVIHWRVPSTQGGAVLTLSRDGVEVDRAPLGSPTVPGGVEGVTTLYDLPTGVGVREVTAHLHLGPDPGDGALTPPVSRAMTLVEAVERPHPVLFHDPRPFWGSTFLRRALDEDLRLRVSARIRTAPGFATTWGTPPQTLTDPGALDDWELVVIGGAESLTPAEVGALERFLRERGGVVLLLLEGTGRGPWERWIPGGANWRSRGGEGAAPSELLWAVPGFERIPSLEASQIVFPDRLPPGARSIAVAPGDLPALWELPVGLGVLIVSGAVDAWQFRDPEGGFEPAWRGLVNWAVNRAPPEVELRADPRVAAPGDEVRVTVTLRRGEGRIEVEGGYAVPSPTREDPTREDPMREDTTGDEGWTPIRFWPTALPGRFEGVLRIPEGLGVGELRVRGVADGVPFDARLPFATVADPGGEGGQAPVDVASTPAWFAARGGDVFPEAGRGALRGALEGELRGERRTERWHPMRSPWWILPFVLLLGVEWAARRRRGLP